MYNSAIHTFFLYTKIVHSVDDEASLNTAKYLPLIKSAVESYIFAIYWFNWHQGLFCLGENWPLTSI